MTMAELCTYNKLCNMAIVSFYSICNSTANKIEKASCQQTAIKNTFLKLALGGAVAQS